MESKTRFFGKVSHEIRTPLNLILGMIDLCEENDTQGVNQRFFSSMRSSGTHLLSMINDLLELAKGASNELAMNESTTALVPVISEVVRSCAHLAHGKDVECRATIALDLPAFVKCDAARIRQVISNLVRNASKYTVQGFVHLRASRIYQDESRLLKLKLEISDTGVGIPASRLPRIFDAFFQVESASQWAEGGVGLGLSIVKDIVSLMKGEISVESKEGQGTTFTVILPLEIVDDRSWVEAYRFRSQGTVHLDIVASDPKFEQLLAPIEIRSDIAIRHWRLADWKAFAAKREIRAKSILVWDGRIPVDEEWQRLMGTYGRTLILDENEREGNVIVNEMCSRISTHPLLLAEVFVGLGFSMREIPAKGFQKPGDSPLSVSSQRKGDEGISGSGNPAESESERSLRILVADDDEGNLELYRAYFLKQTKWVIDYVVNGQQAVEMYQNAHYDVVILDGRMPVLDGYQAYEAIRKSDQGRVSTQRMVPILIVSADMKKDFDERVLNDLNADFLAKPISRSALLEAIQKVAGPVVMK